MDTDFVPDDVVFCCFILDDRWSEVEPPPPSPPLPPAGESTLFRRWLGLSRVASLRRLCADPAPAGGSNFSAVLIAFLIFITAASLRACCSCCWSSLPPWDKSGSLLEQAAWEQGDGIIAAEEWKQICAKQYPLVTVLTFELNGFTLSKLYCYNNRSIFRIYF